MRFLPLLALLALQGHHFAGGDVKLVNVVISCQRFDDSIAFYRQKLGWISFYEDKTSCFFKAGGVNVVLVKAGVSSTKSRICLDLATADLDAKAQDLEGRGIRFEGRTKSMLSFRDPEDNLIEVVHG